MKKKVLTSIGIGGILGFIMAQITSNLEEGNSMKRDDLGYIVVESPTDACAVYPQTVRAVEERSLYAQKNALALITDIVNYPTDLQNKETMLRTLDRAYAFISGEAARFELMKSVHPDETIVEAVEKETLVLTNFSTDYFEGNVALYKAFKRYTEGNAKTENLTEEEQHFLTKLMDGFKREGLDLSEDARKKVIALKKECSALELAFDGGINKDTTTITVSEEELAGVSDIFKTMIPCKDGVYTLAMNYPIMEQVMSNCSVESTRKAYYLAFNNRAFPQNEQLLQQLMQKRHELAKTLGFSSYAAYQLEDKMIKTPERAWDFENTLFDRALTKAQQEIQEYINNLPAGISLTDDGKLKPWDTGYISTAFKKKRYEIDENEFANYFPMEKTVAGLIAIYEQFFSLTITQAPVSGLWHEDVSLLQISEKTSGELLGFVFLDMYPREKKYGHAAQFHGVEGMFYNGTRYPAVCTVVCNFTKSTADRPSLLRYNEVNTFFHEFGHAIHTILGATAYSCQSGTQTERDFVELPSQMLEKWLEDAAILKMISSHFETGQPLPDHLIQKRLDLIKFGTGMFTTRQLFLGMSSLSFFGENPDRPAAETWKEFSLKTRPYLAYEPQEHMYCSFGHLTGYGACYYGYLWSNALACDIFETIEKEGLLNPEAGKKYVQAVLSKGGSISANTMLSNYLGREPQFDAFYKKMGF